MSLLGGSGIPGIDFFGARETPDAPEILGGGVLSFLGDDFLGYDVGFLGSGLPCNGSWHLVLILIAFG